MRGQVGKFCISRRSKKPETSRGRSDLASRLVFLNSIQQFRMGSRNYLRRSEARAFLNLFKIHRLNTMYPDSALFNQNSSLWKAGSLIQRLLIRFHRASLFPSNKDGLLMHVFELKIHNKKNKTYHPISSNSHPSDTAINAIHI